MGQIFMCKLKEIACSDEPTENYQLTLKFPSALHSILASFSCSFFWFFMPQLYCFGSFSPLSQCFQAAVFSNKKKSHCTQTQLATN